MPGEERTASRYAAFISYRHVEPDRTWAKWLHGALETYAIPRRIRGDRELPRRIGRVFRDEEELPASSHLSDEIEKALTSSQFLVVVCSPRTPPSEWVNREIERFRELGRGDRILALLIEGEPREAFPVALREIRKTIVDEAGETRETIEEREPLAADVRPSRDEPRRQLRRTALLRFLAPMLGCRFDDLRRRDAKRARRRRAVALGVLGSLVVIFALLAAYAFRQRDEKTLALTRVLRLSDARELRSVMAAEEELWPIEPGLVSKVDAWVRRVDALEANREVHRADLAEYRALGRQGDDGSWHFESQGDAWLHELLSSLVADLDALLQPETGLRATVLRRREAASSLTDDMRVRWGEQWAQAVRTVQASPLYGGWELTPQLGLVPLGPDPSTGLFEFAHVGSGPIPARDPDTGELELGDAFAIVLVLVPPGTFQMGAQRRSPEDPNYDIHAVREERPVHEVTLTRPFLLGKYEITRAQWTAMGAEDPSQFRVTSLHGGRRVTVRDPVENLTWYDAVRWLGRHRLVLPTEAQWEYACQRGLSAERLRLLRAGRNAEALDGIANVADAAFGEGGDNEARWDSALDDGYVIHAPVGSYPPDLLGLHDMLGNVQEFVSDVWREGQFYPAHPAEDPYNPRNFEDRAARVARGGSFEMLPGETRPSARVWLFPDIVKEDTGLRAAFDFPRD